MSTITPEQAHRLNHGCQNVAEAVEYLETFYAVCNMVPTGMGTLTVFPSHPDFVGNPLPSHRYPVTNILLNRQVHFLSKNIKVDGGRVYEFHKNSGDNHPYRIPGKLITFWMEEGKVVQMEWFGEVRHKGVKIKPLVLMGGGTTVDDFPTLEQDLQRSEGWDGVYNPVPMESVKDFDWFCTKHHGWTEGAPCWRDGGTALKIGVDQPDPQKFGLPHDSIKA